MEHRIFVRIPSEKRLDGILTDKSGWHFRHVLEGPAAKDPASQWYVAWRDDNQDRLTDSGILPAWPKAMKLVPEIADAAFRTFDVFPQLIEPGLTFKETAAQKGAIKLPARLPEPFIPDLQVGKQPSKVWPEGTRTASGLLDPLWYQDHNHTQLSSARAAARRSGASHSIRIGILDTGFDARNQGIPRHLVDEEKADIIQSLRHSRDLCSNGSCRIEANSTPGQTSPTFSGHGTGTLGILGGRKVKLTDPNGRVAPGTYEIGAAPDATIHPVRIAPWVASLSTANLACAIDYASRVKECDVLSISHGGSPSMMWTDAVNAAYDRGTAMFAASGDFFPLPLLPYPFNTTGIIVPSSTVYPASCRRVMAVTGITASGRTYAKNDWSRLLRHPHLIAEGLMHGSYGADGVRRTFLPVPAWERASTDVVQKNRRNELRANPVAAYSPAIPWLKAGTTNVVDLDGGGTSAATPQAAAAAAHWLACHRKEIEAAGAWKNWRKAEATYLAMALTAERKWDKENKREDQRPDMYLGCGILKANDMLGVSYREALSIEGKTLHKPIDKDGNPSMTGAPRDYYDADRSFFTAVLKLDPRSAGSREISQRADFRNGRETIRSHPNQRTEALTDLYFNMLLIRQFQWGNNPINKETTLAHPVSSFFSLTPNECQLEAKARKLANGINPSPARGPRQ